jgi:hypothetical protein
MAAWWRELADLRPRRLWISHLLLHRVEALARVVRTGPIEPLSRALLRYLSLKDPLPPAALAGRLGMNPQALARWLAELAGAGLAAETPGGWVATEAGREARERGQVCATAAERRSFTFLDRAEEGLPPLFLALPAVGEPAAGPEHPLDMAVLEEHVLRPADWKARHHFPADVAGVLLPTDDGADWRRVVLDRPGQLPAVLAEVGGETAEGTHLVGFAVGVPGWALRREPLLFDFAEGWQREFPHLAAGLPAEAWRQAWQTWCQPRGLPRAEVEACRAELAGHLLRVAAPPRLVERLRAAHSDAVKGEAWLLAGAGRTRAAALIELREVPAP